MIEERLKLAVFIDFDNIQIGVKDTLRKEFDVSVVLEALKERGEVVTKIAYGDWPRSGEHSRQMTQHAVQMVQRNVTPRGDKNGADINLALDALEMAFNRPYINAFVIVGGDSDFIALVEKLKQYDKRVLVVGGRAFTSNILQRNCHEFIAYENLLKAAGDGARRARSSRGRPRAAGDGRSLSDAMPNVERALKVLAEREVAPQIGLLKSTLLQLDPTFSERDYGSGSFLEFIEKLHEAGLVRLRRTDRGHLVELADDSGERDSAQPAREPEAVEPLGGSAEAMDLLRQAMTEAAGKTPNKPLYLRQVSQLLRSGGKDFDARRYGFRGVVDLLHQGQREGILRVHRDRKGVLRVFPALPAGATADPAGTEEPLTGTPSAAEPEPAEVDVAWGEPSRVFDADPEEVAPAMADAGAPAEGAGGETASEEAAEEARPRRRRARAGSKPGARRGPRRKAKEPAEG